MMKTENDKPLKNSLPGGFHQTQFSSSEINSAGLNLKMIDKILDETSERVEHYISIGDYFSAAKVIADSYHREVKNGNG